LKDAAGLLPDLLERVPDSRSWGAAHFELCDHTVDAFDVRINSRAVVATDRARERNVANVFSRHFLHKPYFATAGASAGSSFFLKMRFFAAV
jgi:hypothetical protein